MSEPIIQRESQPVSDARSIDHDRVVSGLMFMTYGILLWLYVRDQIALVDFTTFWPVPLIVCGLVTGLTSRRRGAKGWTQFVVGTFFQLYILGYAEWPLLLVGLGVVMLVRGLGDSARLRREGARHA